MVGLGGAASASKKKVLEGRRRFPSPFEEVGGWVGGSSWWLMGWSALCEVGSRPGVRALKVTGSDARQLGTSTLEAVHGPEWECS